MKDPEKDETILALQDLCLRLFSGSIEDKARNLALHQFVCEFYDDPAFVSIEERKAKIEQLYSEYYAKLATLTIQTAPWLLNPHPGKEPSGN